MGHSYETFQTLNFTMLQYA